MQKIVNYAAAVVLCAGIITGCSGSGGDQMMSGSTSVTGKVADGYLANAVVFLDKNGNYQLDAGEPNMITDPTGSFTLTIDQADLGRYPIVALAVKDQTIDMDAPGVTLGNSYVLSMHALSITQDLSGTVTGTVSNFISPISTLIRETLEANPAMTVAEAMTQVRNQLNLPPAINMQRDYVFGSMSGAHKPEFQKMHRVAQDMAGLMGQQAGLVMSGRNLQITPYRQMMGQIGDNLPQIVSGTDMTALRDRMASAIMTMPSEPLSNLPLFSTYTSQRSFWNLSSGMMYPRHRMR